MTRYLPLAPGTYSISSGYGPRDGQMHQGMDFAAELGTPIYAPLDGDVVEGIERQNVVGFGRWVWLDCQQAAGVDIIIGHLDPAVRGGSRVRAGQIIGYVNTYGQSTGPHAHVEIWTPPGRVGGRAVDPAPWFAQALDPRTLQQGAPAVADPITRTQLSPNRHSGGRNVSWIAIHTQEGPGTAASLTDYLCNPSSEVSYNAVVDDHETVLVVPWDENPWSASNANPRADHICMAGTYVAWSRGKWLESDRADGVDEDEMLTRTAALVAWRCLQRGIPIEYVGGGSQPPDRPGICGHRDFGQWGGGHTDPGPNFPWDELIRRARAIAEGDDMPSPEDIAKAVWGHRLTKPDGVATETTGNLLGWIDQHAGDTLDQVTGPKTKDQRGGPLAPTGWTQLGGKSLVDRVAADSVRLTALESKLDRILALLEKRS